MATKSASAKPSNRAKPIAAGARPDDGGKGFLLAIIAIVVLGAGAVAVLASQRDSKVGEQSGEVTVQGQALPMFDRSGVSDGDDPAVGLVAPTLAGETFAGEPLSIGPDGSPKVIYFLAHWCAHCRAEVPTIQRLIDEDRLPEGLEIYAVSTAVDSTRGNYPPESWLGLEGFTPPTMKDSAGSAALLAHGGASFPYAVYLDGENRVIARSSGELGEQAISELWGMTAANGSE
jgi:thiol-disulfide isomerase/thioredoxin